jgi:hypothetical protein
MSSGVWFMLLGSLFPIVKFKQNVIYRDHIHVILVVYNSINKIVSRWLHRPSLFTSTLISWDMPGIRINSLPFRANDLTLKILIFSNLSINYAINPSVFITNKLKIISTMKIKNYSKSYWAFLNEKNQNILNLSFLKK